MLDGWSRTLIGSMVGAGIFALLGEAGAVAGSAVWLSFLLAGIASWLGYVSAIVIVGAMVAVSFGGYATSPFVGSHAAAGWDNAFTTFVVLLTLGINMVGTRLVDRAQTAIELAVFTVFIVLTISDAD